MTASSSSSRHPALAPAGLSKPQWRQNLRQLRRALPGERRRILSASISRHLVAWLLQFAGRPQTPFTVALYAATRFEPDIDAAAGALGQQGFDVGWPRAEAEGEAIHLSFRRADDVAKLRPGRWGLREPLACAPRIEPHTLGVLVLPCVGLDRRGTRLGSGLGLYDRALQDTPAYVVGVGFDCQVVERLPQEPHDVLCSSYITESGAVDIRRGVGRSGR